MGNGVDDCRLGVKLHGGRVVRVHHGVIVLRAKLMGQLRRFSLLLKHSRHRTGRLLGFLGGVQSLVVHGNMMMMMMKARLHSLVAKVSALSELFNFNVVRVRDDTGRHIDRHERCMHDWVNYLSHDALRRVLHCRHSLLVDGRSSGHIIGVMVHGHLSGDHRRGDSVELGRRVRLDSLVHISAQMVLKVRLGRGAHGVERLAVDWTMRFLVDHWLD